MSRRTSWRTDVCVIMDLYAGESFCSIIVLELRSICKPNIIVISLRRSRLRSRLTHLTAMFQNYLKLRPSNVFRSSRTSFSCVDSLVTASPILREVITHIKDLNGFTINKKPSEEEPRGGFRPCARKPALSWRVILVSVSWSGHLANE